MDYPMIDFNEHRFEKDIILVCVRYNLAALGTGVNDGRVRRRD